MRKEVLGKIHQGHLGAEKQKRLARGTVYRPNINQNIDDMTQACEASIEFRPSQKKVTFCVDEEKGTAGPRDILGSDLFQWQGREYLLVIDYHSNYPEIILLSSTTSDCIHSHSD